MTRRKDKQAEYRDSRFRAQRIAKLVDRGWIESPSEIPDEAIPVDPALVNLGGTWNPPVCFRDVASTCRDCGSEEIWKAADQAWYFETTNAPIHAQAVRCLPCRQLERARKQQARRDAGHDR